MNMSRSDPPHDLDLPAQLPAIIPPSAVATTADTDPVALVPALIADAGERRLALCRILHRQHPQPQHAARLRAGVR